MRISIVTPALNRADFVLHAIKSVSAQAHPDVEHLIVDGGSTDGSLEVYSRFPNLKVTVEADKNVYDAFNKGIQRSTGYIIGIMNTDDAYTTDILSTVVTIFEENPEVEMVSGGCVFVEEGADRKREVLYRYLHPKILGLDPKSIVRYPVMVNARFFRRSLFEKVGYFDIDLPVVADREFLLRCRAKGVINKTISKVVCEYGVHQGAISHRKEGVGEKILLENMNCAMDRAKNGKGSTKTIWEFWAVWSVLLLAVQRCSHKGLLAAIRTVGSHSFLMFRYAPILLIEVLKHWMERNQKTP